MESGPESVSSNQSSMNPIINGQIASNSETKESTKASEASSSASSSVSSWSFLSSAKNALISLRDAILNKNSSPTDSLSQLEASTSTSTVTRVAAKDYDKAKSNFDTAKSGLENAKTLAEYETKMADLMAALQDMEANSDPSNDHTEELNNIKKALEAQKDTIDKLNKLVTLQNQNKSLTEALKTTDSADQIPAINSRLEINKNSAHQIIKELKEQISNYKAVLTDVEKVIKEFSEAGIKLGQALQSIVDAGDQSQAAVLQARQSNSPDNIAATKKLIDAAKTKVNELKQEHQEIADSPLVKKAEEQINQAQQDIQTITPSGLDIPIVGPSGSAASAGSAAGALKSSNNSGRISLLLDDVDNEMAAIAMQGFRSMIEQFNVNNPATAKELQAMEAQLTAMSDQLVGADGELPAEIQAIKDALAQALKQPSADGLATAMGQVAFAAAKVGGGSAGTAGTVQMNVKQLYKTAFSSTSSSSYAAALSDGYSAYKTLNSLYSESRSGVQSAISQTANPALSRSVSRSGIESQGRSADASQRAAETIVRDSQTLGDVYSRLQVLDSLMSTIVSNPQANQEEIMQKLTASISKAPQFGYPAVQNSVDSLQKFAAQLEREFVDGERSLAESQENAFRKQPAFIQQVLVNIASLFSGYLS
ncbi:hypothetical protein FTN76_04685 [Chlamydia trachomatis]|uniref:CHLPN 76kDa-like protein n=1 Tax=Chlamydia trachomatis serovar L2 (strain ATCC VR-902B / DSM 19102 / 434/Bu) TaxID=471472 RepID=A0A0H3MDV9_CHLT2|nr:hypothetical protein [Chlamydia trachomatis]AGJ65003.1 hypothetical protein CTLINITIAL_04620 [Chlamydia trachomatis L2/434/Bu(i)]AGJ65944.1 hypothetical protein CTLFINAL_04625 [Chlamydia trachomatis L2/434/Bu(f)]AGR94982.1 hypothetical protein CTRC46_03280 [Chlamydia trachomatis RC-L2(s)/46]AGR96861.1 hypothetical protein CTRC943_03265 [Chlamydia trachomatis RC-J/943]AGR98702.1 hypothetical protein CTRC3_03305 [Chlamydia trachomatis RC-L2(s)/3]